MEVTTASTRIGKFEASDYFVAAFKENLFVFKGHSGPINCVALHPDDKRHTFKKINKKPQKLGKITQSHSQ
uniref:Uncharacterized protein n=1 Tax=Cynoglossus semilaevis TaxID=244447 RepID=A0A3P8WC67_CYNSE